MRLRTLAFLSFLLVIISFSSSIYFKLDFPGFNNALAIPNIPPLGDRAGTLSNQTTTNEMLTNNQQKGSSGTNEFFQLNKTTMQPGLYGFGTIASLQNDENGIPRWHLSGLWEAI